MTIQFSDLPFEVQGVIANFAEGKDRLSYLSTCKTLHRENQTAFYEGILQILLQQKFEPSRIERAGALVNEETKGPKIEKIKKAIASLYNDFFMSTLMNLKFPYEKDPLLAQEIIRNCNHGYKIINIIGTPGKNFHPALVANSLQLLSENKLETNLLHLEIYTSLDSATQADITYMLYGNRTVKEMTLEFKEWPYELKYFAECLKKSAVKTAVLVSIDAPAFPEERLGELQEVLKEGHSILHSSVNSSPALLIEKK